MLLLMNNPLFEPAADQPPPPTGNQPPQIVINQPGTLNGTAPFVVNIKATVTDPDGLPAVVNLKKDGVVVQSLQGPSGTTLNVAAAVNGGVASASSFYDGNYVPQNAIDGDRAGHNWWNDGTQNAMPDWLRVDFKKKYSINKITVIGVQTNYQNPIDPTPIDEPPEPDAPPDPSPNDTKGGEIVDSTHARWTLGTDVPGGKQTLRDGVWINNGGATEYEYHNGDVYCHGSGGHWYRFANNVWNDVGTADPAGGGGPGPQPDPEPTPDPTYLKVGEPLRISTAYTHGAYIDASNLFAAWQHDRYGDWRNADNVAQGGAPYYGQTTVVGEYQNFGITLLPALIERERSEKQGIYLYAPNHPTSVCWISRAAFQLVVVNDSDQTFNLTPTVAASGSADITDPFTEYLFNPIFLNFDWSQITGVVKSATLKGTLGWNAGTPLLLAVQALDNPTVLSDPSSQAPERIWLGIRDELTSEEQLKTHPDVLYYYDMSSLAQINHDWDNVNNKFTPAPYPNDWRSPYQFGTWDDHQGVNYVQVDNQYYASWAFDHANPYDAPYLAETITSWRGKHSVVDLSALTECYMNYTLKPMADAGDPTHPIFATKLPGFASSNETGVTHWGGWYVMRMQHGLPSPANPGLLKFWPHFYWDQWLGDPNNTGFAQTFPQSDLYLRVMEVNTIEQYIKPNTINPNPDIINSDGICQAWVNGALAIDMHNVNFRSNWPDGSIGHIFFDIFSGGQGLSNGLLTYQIGPCVLAKRLIGRLKKSAVPVVPTSSPLVGRPSTKGTHITTTIAGLGNAAWANLGAATADSTWGSAEGRSWGPKMPYSSALGGAFLAGQGPGGGTIVRSGHARYDSLWFYDFFLHKWVCLYPGIDTTTFAADVAAGRIAVVGPRGLQHVTGSTGIPNAQDVYASGAHAYQFPFFNEATHKFSTTGWRGGSGGDQYVLGDTGSWYYPAKVSLESQEDSQSPALDTIYTRNARPPFTYDTVTGALRRDWAAFGMLYVPAIAKAWALVQGAVYLDGVAARAAGTPPPILSVSDFGACVDTNRNRVVTGASPVGTLEGVWVHDIVNNAWSNPTPVTGDETQGIMPSGGKGVVNFDSHADRVITFANIGGGTNLYVCEWNPTTGQWVGPPVLAPFAYVAGLTGFYSPQENVHILYRAADGVTGDFRAYRHKV